MTTPAPSPMTNPARVASNGPGRPRRILVLGHEPAHRAEAGQDQRMDARLGAAGEHRVGVAAADELGALADRVRAGRAGRDDRVVRAAEPERDRDLAARRVDEHVGQEVRARRGRARARAACRTGAAARGARRSPSRGRRRRGPARSRSMPASPIASFAAASAKRMYRSSRFISLAGASPFAVEALDLGGYVHRVLARVERADEVDAAPPLDAPTSTSTRRRCRAVSPPHPRDDYSLHRSPPA